MITQTTEIWKAFGDRLRRYIRKSVGNEADADDVLQDVFTRLQAGIKGVRDSAKLESWIFQVTRYAIVDHLRNRAGRKRWYELPSDLVEEPAPQDMSALVASWLTPLMTELPEEDREALRLTAIEGLSQKDLAARLSLSTTGARSRVQRARNRLKQVLLDCCQIERDRRGNAISFTRRRDPCGACSCE